LELLAQKTSLLSSDFNALQRCPLTVSDTTEKDIYDTLQVMLKHPIPDPLELVADIQAIQAEKYDIFVTEQLLRQEFVARNLDLPGAYQAIYAMLRLKSTGNS
jgi:hypothetical protein